MHQYPLRLRSQQTAGRLHFHALSELRRTLLPRSRWQLDGASSSDGKSVPRKHPIVAIVTDVPHARGSMCYHGQGTIDSPFFVTRRPIWTSNQSHGNRRKTSGTRRLARSGRTTARHGVDLSSDAIRTTTHCRRSPAPLVLRRQPDGGFGPLGHPVSVLAESE